MLIKRLKSWHWLTFTPAASKQVFADIFQTTTLLSWCQSRKIHALCTEIKSEAELRMPTPEFGKNRFSNWSHHESYQGPSRLTKNKLNGIKNPYTAFRFKLVGVSAKDQLLFNFCTYSSYSYPYIINDKNICSCPKFFRHAFEGIKVKKVKCYCNREQHITTRTLLRVFCNNRFFVTIFTYLHIEYNLTTC